eukprot:NODE_9205_length_1439_cov_15.718750.p1 GENE.NODE_9205_length_1439_cov_15.718750~~NODE_9205_length_1439_cov_15.718750.p1  ORF type:complete len:350 (-),score=32.65 NODE_9205_length_1439_cov_15.718750:279-1328(-)
MLLKLVGDRLSKKVQTGRRARVFVAISEDHRLSPLAGAVLLTGPEAVSSNSAAADGKKSWLELNPHRCTLTIRDEAVASSSSDNRSNEQVLALDDVRWIDSNRQHRRIFVKFGNRRCLRFTVGDEAAFLRWFTSLQVIAEHCAGNGHAATADRINSLDNIGSQVRATSSPTRVRRRVPADANSFETDSSSISGSSQPAAQLRRKSTFNHRASMLPDPDEGMARTRNVGGGLPGEGARGVHQHIPPDMLNPVEAAANVAAHLSSETNVRRRERNNSMCVAGGDAGRRHVMQSAAAPPDHSGGADDGRTRARQSSLTRNAPPHCDQGAGESVSGPSACRYLPAIRASYTMI